jgi:DNA replication ATP-dependent helicase Dna2
VALIQRLAALAGCGAVEVSTVDRYQGRDKRCVLLSLVRSNADRRAPMLPLLIRSPAHPSTRLPGAARWGAWPACSGATAARAMACAPCPRPRWWNSAPGAPSPLTAAPALCPGREAGRLLADGQRINVAITRAKHKLLLVGSATTLASVPLLAQMLELLRARGWWLQLDAAVAEAMGR